jgi:hypothetical protein
MKTVSGSGAPAIRMIRMGKFPNTVGFVFRTSDLKGINPGKKVSMTVQGELKNKGKTYTFTGADTISVISNPDWQLDDIKDVSRNSDDDLFNNRFK